MEKTSSNYSMYERILQLKQKINSQFTCTLDLHQFTHANDEITKEAFVILSELLVNNNIAFKQLHTEKCTISTLSKRVSINSDDHAYLIDNVAKIDDKIVYVTRRNFHLFIGKTINIFNTIACAHGDCVCRSHHTITDKACFIAVVHQLIREYTEFIKSHMPSTYFSNTNLFSKLVNKFNKLINVKNTFDDKVVVSQNEINVFMEIIQFILNSVNVIKQHTKKDKTTVTLGESIIALFHKLEYIPIDKFNVRFNYCIDTFNIKSSIEYDKYLNTDNTIDALMIVANHQLKYLLTSGCAAQTQLTDDRCMTILSLQLFNMIASSIDILFNHIRQALCFCTVKNKPGNISARSMWEQRESLSDDNTRIKPEKFVRGTTESVQILDDYAYRTHGELFTLPILSSTTVTDKPTIDTVSIDNIVHKSHVILNMLGSGNYKPITHERIGLLIEEQNTLIDKYIQQHSNIYQIHCKVPSYDTPNMQDYERPLRHIKLDISDTELIKLTRSISIFVFAAFTKFQQVIVDAYKYKNVEQKDMVPVEIGPVLQLLHKTMASIGHDVTLSASNVTSGMFDILSVMNYFIAVVNVHLIKIYKAPHVIYSDIEESVLSKLFTMRLYTKTNTNDCVVKAFKIGTDLSNLLHVLNDVENDSKVFTAFIPIVTDIQQLSELTSTNNNNTKSTTDHEVNIIDYTDKLPGKQQDMKNPFYDDLSNYIALQTELIEMANKLTKYRYSLMISRLSDELTNIKKLAGSPDAAYSSNRIFDCISIMFLVPNTNIYIDDDAVQFIINLKQIIDTYKTNAKMTTKIAYDICSKLVAFLSFIASVINISEKPRTMNSIDAVKAAYEEFIEPHPFLIELIQYVLLNNRVNNNSLYYRTDTDMLVTIDINIIISRVLTTTHRSNLILTCFDKLLRSEAKNVDEQHIATNDALSDESDTLGHTLLDHLRWRNSIRNANVTLAYVKAMYEIANLQTNLGQLQLRKLTDVYYKYIYQIFNEDMFYVKECVNTNLIQVRQYTYPLDKQLPDIYRDLFCIHKLLALLRDCSEKINDPTVEFAQIYDKVFNGAMAKSKFCKRLNSYLKAHNFYGQSKSPGDSRKMLIKYDNLLVDGINLIISNKNSYWPD